MANCEMRDLPSIVLLAGMAGVVRIAKRLASL
jgi:hypothetical protein